LRNSSRRSFLEQNERFSTLEFIRKKDPHGFYIIYVKREVEKELEKYNNILIENYGDCLIIKTRSRRIALSIINRFKNRLCLE